jgi:hypothetical protein
MNYVNYNVKVVQAYQVKLVGWTYSSFVSPGEISTVSDIQCLRDALKIGTCKWVHLTTHELNKHMEEYEKQCQAGEVVPKKRKECSDKGKKRKATAGDISDSEGSGLPRKKRSLKEKGSARCEVVSAALEKRKASTSGASHAMSQLPPSLKRNRKVITDTDEQQADEQETDDDD